LALQPEITFRALEKPREQAHAETTREKRKENVTPKQQTPKPFSNPLAKSTVEIWYMEDVFNARNALKIQKHLESVGAKVSLKFATFPYPVPIDSHIIYYRDPSNLEAAIQTEEVVRQDGMQGFRIAALPTSNTDLTITIPIVP
jgi:hypothetical protein